MANTSVEEQTTKALESGLQSLTADDTNKLSKVLFPDTHTDKVELLGKSRTLRPVPLKVSKQISSILDPISEKIQAAFTTPEETVRLDEDVINSLISCSVVLATYYDWQDVLAALATEDITLGDLQGLATVQSQLNGQNDFLLAPLRVIVSTMKILEVLGSQFQNMLTLLHSSKGGIVASMSSSPNTPTAN